MSAPELTARQHDVLELVELGYTDKDIAERLRIRVRTVRTHLEVMYERFGVHTRTGLVRAWRQMRTTDPSAPDPGTGSTSS